jgi:hypothetical protein
MSENFENAGETVARSLVSALPQPIQTAAIPAISRLIGGFAAWAGAYFKRQAQAVDDVTNGRSHVSNELSKLIADRCKENPAILAAAEEIYLPETVRKIRNKLEIAGRTLDELNASSSDTGQSSEKEPLFLNNPDEDWMNLFLRLSEDATSDRLQNLLAKILAGEIKKKGAYSASSVRIIIESHADIIEEFKLFCEKVIDDWVFRSEDYSVGPRWNVVERLVHAGLVSPISSAIHSPQTSHPYWGVHKHNAHLQIVLKHGCRALFPTIRLTRSGKEISGLFPRSDDYDDLISIADSLPYNSIEFSILTVFGRNGNNGSFIRLYHEVVSESLRSKFPDDFMLQLSIWRKDWVR